MYVCVCIYTFVYKARRGLRRHRKEDMLCRACHLRVLAAAPIGTVCIYLHIICTFMNKYVYIYVYIYVCVGGDR